MEKIKTAEEMLNDFSSDTTTKGRVKFSDALKAMEAYALQESKQKEERIKELEEKIDDWIGEAVKREKKLNELSSEIVRLREALEGVSELLFQAAEALEVYASSNNRINVLAPKLK